MFLLYNKGVLDFIDRLRPQGEPSIEGSTQSALLSFPIIFYEAQSRLSSQTALKVNDATSEELGLIGLKGVFKILRYPQITVFDLTTAFNRALTKNAVPWQAVLHFDNDTLHQDEVEELTKRGIPYQRGGIDSCAHLALDKTPTLLLVPDIFSMGRKSNYLAFRLIKEPNSSCETYDTKTKEWVIHDVSYIDMLWSKGGRIAITFEDKPAV